MDTIFWYTLLFIFLSALVGAFLNSRAKDHCLRDFDGFRVTLEESDGDRIWGELVVFSTGLELEYTAAHQDTDGHIETSYILYKEQYPTIQAIYRYQDELPPEMARQRELSIQHTYHPGTFRRLGRNVRNIFNTFKDSIFQSIGLMVGQAQKMNPKSTLLKTQNKQITSISQDIVSISANAYEPILEKYIGRNVVLEYQYSGEVYECFGILKEYTNEFIELLNIERLDKMDFEAVEDRFVAVNQNLEVKRNGADFQIKNKGSLPVFLKDISSGEMSQLLALIIEPGSSVDFSFAGVTESMTAFTVSAVRQADVIMPRKLSLIRHGADIHG